MLFSRRSFAQILSVVVLMTSACGKSDGTGPGANGIECQPTDPICPPAELSVGFSGPEGSPEIDPTSFSGTSVSHSGTSLVVLGNTTSTEDGWWLIVVGTELRAYGVLTVDGGVFGADIPLFCGAQSLILTFEGGSGRSYFNATVTQTDCTVPQFRAQLSWDTPDSDIDLHLIRPGGTVESGDDCYWANCQSTFLEWGAAGPAGNPILDVDDVTGYGPENIFLGSGAEVGQYTIVVHNWSGTPNTRATVKLYFDDVEAARYTSNPLDSPSSLYWEVARVNITTKQITPVNTYGSGPPAAGVGAPAAAAPRAK